MKLTEGINLGLAVLLCIDDYPGLCHTDWSKPIGYNWCSTHIYVKIGRNCRIIIQVQCLHVSKNIVQVYLNSSLSAFQTIEPSVFCMFNCPNSHCNKISHAGYAVPIQSGLPSIPCCMFIHTQVFFVCLII